MTKELSYGARSGKPSLWRGHLAVGLVVLISFAIWAKGRGYKTAILHAVAPRYFAGIRHPSVIGSRPADHDGDVPPDAFIACDVELPNVGKGVDGATLPSGVRLFRTNNQAPVEIKTNTTGGGDAIVIRPEQRLDTSTQYTLEILPAVKDTSGTSFEHYTTTFTTAAGSVYSTFPAAAEKVALPSSQLPKIDASGQGLSPSQMPSYTCVTFGPDGRLYSTTTDGQIIRFDVLPDGTLGAPTPILTVHAANHAARLVTSICFDPTATADHLVAWVSHGEGIQRSAKPADWTGKISRVSGPDLATYEDYVVGLPRARADHVTDQIIFGPDGALYFAQASNTAMGAADKEWGYRPEHLLTACILRLDTRAAAAHPLDVKTEEGGTYNPFSPDAPLTIYASGVRNAYDMLWHSNGSLYVPVNGSAAGGNSPATPPGGACANRRLDAAAKGPYCGPEVIALKGLPTQADYLLRVERGGYYGHPNPTRAEFVISGGNPTGPLDPCEVPEYPRGTSPDRNWRPPVYDFGKNLAPCGIIEYKGNAFPALKGKILIARYSGGKDVFVVTPGKNGEIVETVAGIEGFTSFYDPLDLCESPKTGYLYVAEYGGKRITLLRPRIGIASDKAIRQMPLAGNLHMQRTAAAARVE